MNRRGRSKPTSIQTFAFLDALICTMGALLVLLYAFASHGKNEVDKKVAEQQKAQAAQDAIDAEDFRWRSTHLREARDKTQADLEAERLKLSHIEDHQRRLEEKLAQLKIAADELAKTHDASSGQRTRNEAELASVQQQLTQARAALDEARKQGKHEAVNYSVVPFDGRNGTHRRPIYIECTENKIVIQPEGIELAPADFIGYFGPGNPLAAGLRAQREYFARQSSTGKLEEEPYPLLLVRPEGISAYYAARAALESWGSDFGYELIGADWSMAFPPNDPQLKAVTEQVVREARERLTEYIASSPQFQRRKARPVYHADTRGGISQERGTGDGPGGSYLGEWDDPVPSGGGSDMRGSGGAYAAGGTNRDGSGGLNGSPLDDYAAQGLAGGDPYAEPGSIGPTMGGSQSGSRIDGSQYAAMREGNDGQTNAGGYGPGGAQAQDGPYGGSGPSQGADKPGGASGVPQTRVGPATVGGGPTNKHAPSGSNDLASSQAAGQASGAQPDSAAQKDARATQNYHLMEGNGQAKSGGATTSGKETRDAQPNRDRMSAQDGYEGEPSDAMDMQEPPPGDQQQLVRMKHKPKHSVATVRGRGWGVNSQVGAIGATRPVLVRCTADKLVIVSESRTQPPREIALGPATEAAIDDLVSGIWSHTEGWGKAGRGMYWKPTLVVEVLPGGEGRFEDIQLLLTDSGLDVQRRGGRPPAQQAVRPENQR